MPAFAFKGVFYIFLWLQCILILLWYLSAGFEVDLDESASAVSCLYTLTNADLLEEEVKLTYPFKAHLTLQVAS